MPDRAGPDRAAPGRVERPGWTRPVVRAGYPVLGAATAVFAASLVLRPAGAFLPVFDIDLSLGIEVTASVLCLVGALAGPVLRPGRLLLGSAMLLWSTGDVLFSVASPQGAAVPSTADAFFLAFYPLAFAAIFTMIGRESPRPGMLSGSWADGVLTGLGCLTVVSTLGADQALRPPGGSAAAVVVTLAYPIGDLALLSTVVGMLAVVPPREILRHLSWVLVLAGAGLFAVSDTWYLIASADGSYQQGCLVDAGWTAALVLMSGTAWTPLRPRPEVAAAGVPVEMASGAPVAATVAGSSAASSGLPAAATPAEPSPAEAAVPATAPAGLVASPGWPGAAGRLVLPGAAALVGLGVLVYATPQRVNVVDIALATVTLLAAAVLPFYSLWEPASAAW